MVTPLVKPASMLQPFANIGGRNTIPNTPDATPGHASYDLGFPPLTRTPIEQGGIPPSGLDMNGLGYAISAHTAWMNAGGQYTFDAALATFTGGYKLGAVLQSDDGLSSYRSMVANNTDNFNTTPSVIGVTWEPYAGQAVSGTAASVSVASGNVTLNTAQAAAAIINVTGTLTGNATVTFPTPSAPRSWRITNNTTGGFTLGAKLATGGTLTLTQTKSNQLFFNGSTLQYGNWDSGLDSPAFRGVPTAPTAAPLTNNTQLATTAYANAADTALLVSPALSGTPTVPTAPPLTNNTQIASTAYADAAATAAASGSVPVYVNSNISAGAVGLYWVDTTAGAVTITLPLSPVGKNLLVFEDVAGMWGTNNLIINPQSNTILGSPGNLTCDVSGDQALGLWWDTVNLTWRLK